MFEKVNEILHFWLGKPGEAIDEYAARWWQADVQFDETIRERFGPLHQAAQEKKLEGWKQSPQSCLAYIILIDQFSRNIFRGAAQSFAFDPMALDACTEGIAHRIDKELGFIERFFFYMPLEHSEEILNQKQGIAQFRLLLDEARAAASTHVDILQGAYAFAIKHFEVIERFGRFPHRNVILGRKSTKAERIYLEEFPSGF